MTAETQAGVVFPALWIAYVNAMAIRLLGQACQQIHLKIVIRSAADVDLEQQWT